MAYITKDGERLYLKTWEYNAARIMSALALIVENHGGRVKPTKIGIISDRDTEKTSVPITVTHTTFINFVLDDIYYYYQVDDNPFFDFYYSKTPIKNGSYSGDAMLEADKKEWLCDCYFNSNCAKSEITEGASLIFDMLRSAPLSTIFRDSYKKTVANTYNDGWHKELVCVPERMVKVEF